MNRAVWFIICLVVGLELIAWGLLVPAHFGAIDADVLALSGNRGRGLMEEGLALVNLEKAGAARLLARVSEETGHPSRERLASALATLELTQPKLKALGAPAPTLEKALEGVTISNRGTNEGFVGLLVPATVRQRLTEHLQLSQHPAAVEILATRELTNTTVFPPALSSSGQPLEATILTTALLAEQDQFSSELRNAIHRLVTTASRGGEVAPLESFYLDVLALGRRLDWGQLVNLIQRVQTEEDLSAAAAILREYEASLPTIYMAIHFTESPRGVAKYVRSYPSSAIKDLKLALNGGGGAVRELVTRQLSVHHPTWRHRLTRYAWVQAGFQPMAQLVTDHPWFGFAVKYSLCLLGALLMARAFTYLSPALADEIAENHPVLTGPQVAIALCLLFAVLFTTESVGSRAVPSAQLPWRIKIPVASAAPRATIPQKTRAMIDKISMVSLLTFFVFQAAIYVFCRMKLAEIRRQALPSKLKLRLLENEEQLFDAGLYFGFVGTVVSLILVSVGIIKPSLMAAYSSTSFGIVFVSILKIFHVRPYRRRLILDAEITEREPQPA